MTLRAMRLGHIYGYRSVTSPDILPLRDRFQMVWVEAIPYATQMVENESIRNNANELFVADPVDITDLSGGIYLAVAS